MIPKSGNRFSDQIMRKMTSMIPKSGNRFSDQIMRKTTSMIPKSGNRFLATNAKRVCAEIMRKSKDA
jgi:hypothetical protein